MTGAPLPWTWRAVAVVLALNMAGLAVIAIGWGWASGQTVDGDQLRPTNLAITGLILAAGANGAWLLSGRRALARARRLLLAPWADQA